MLALRHVLPCADFRRVLPPVPLRFAPGRFARCQVLGELLEDALHFLRGERPQGLSVHIAAHAERERSRTGRFIIRKLRDADEVVSTLGPINGDHVRPALLESRPRLFNPLYGVLDVADALNRSTCTGRRTLA